MSPTSICLKGTHDQNWYLLSSGSSLDLAPSLLDLYDGIIASASQEHEGQAKSSNESGKDNHGEVAVARYISDDASIGTTGAATLDNSRVTNQESCHPRPSPGGIHKRSGSGGKQQLPSLSVPPDRPVSMAEAEGDIGARDTYRDAGQQKKQRPLSMSSGVPSTSPSAAPSLSRMRRKQTNSIKGNQNFGEDMIPEHSSDEINELSGPSLSRCRGHCTNAKADGLASSKRQSPMPSSVTLVSESRNSVDSGCVLHGDGSVNLTRGTARKDNGERSSKVGVNNNVNEDGESCEATKTSCSCYLYDDMSISSSDTAGSGSLSYRDEVDSSTSSIREGSAPLLAPVSSSSSSASSLTPTDKSSAKDTGVSGSKDSFSARRSITGLPISVSEGLISSSPSSSSSSRRYQPSHQHSPSSLPLGHHYQNYQPLDERLATSPDGTSKYHPFFSPSNDSGLATDHMSTTPGSRLSGPVASPWSNSSSIVSGMDDTHNTGPDSPDSYSSSSTKSGNSARRSSSFSKSEARKRFFTNYEEHMRQMEEEQSEQDRQAGAAQAPLPGPEDNDSVTSSKSSPRKDLSVPHPQYSEKTASCEMSTEDSSNSPNQGQCHKQPQTPPNSTSNNKPSPSPSFHQPPSTLSSSVTKSPSKLHSPPISPSGHRISSSGHSSKGGKKREHGSTSGDSKPSGSGYVSYVQRVVAEILESERTYIASLKDIIQVIGETNFGLSIIERCY